MLPSKCYFSSINCPFYEENICDRPHCHFKHSKKFKNNDPINTDTNKNYGSEKLFIKHLVKETVKHVLNHVEIKGSTEGNPDISTVVEDVVYDIQNSSINVEFLNTLFSKNQVIPEYKPTPIEKLNRHIPVPVAPTRQSSQISNHNHKRKYSGNVHAQFMVNKDCHLNEGKPNFLHCLSNTTSAGVSKDSYISNNFSMNEYEDSSDKNITAGCADQLIHSLSDNYHKMTKFENYTTIKVPGKFPVDSFGFIEKSVASVDKIYESEEVIQEGNEQIHNDPVETSSSEHLNKNSKTESNPCSGLSKYDEIKFYKGDETFDKIDCSIDNVKIVESNQERKAQSLNEIGTVEAKDRPEVDGKTDKKVDENNHKNLENLLDNKCQQKLEKNEEINNLDDKNSLCKEKCTIKELSPEMSIKVISSKQNKTDNKVRRISIVGGGLPCNSLISGPFVNLLERWRKAKEKIQRSSLQNNQQVAKVDNVVSLLTENNDIKPSNCTQHNSLGKESEVSFKPSLKRRIAHQQTFDTTISTILEQKLKHVRRSL